MVLTAAELQQVRDMLIANKDKLVQWVKNAEDDETQTGIDAWNAQLVIANQWWNTTIKPTLTWNNTQPLTEQRVNILNDYNMVKGLLTTETDKARINVIRTKLKQAEEKFKEIKKALNP